MRRRSSFCVMLLRQTESTRSPEATKNRLMYRLGLFMTMKINKKLSYCRGTARRAMLVNSCYVSRAMGVVKVSYNKRDLQDHSRALALVPFDRPHDFLLVFHCNYVSTLHREILSLISQDLNRSRNSEHIPGSNISRMHSYSSVSMSTRNLKCLASPITKK